MNRRVLALVITALPLLITQSAAASIEVGNKCVANDAEKNLTIFGTANGPGSPLPATIPSAGVITRWTFNSPSVPPGVLNQKLKVVRPAGGPGQVQIAGESVLEPIVTGLSTFSTRVPVQAGDRLGTYGIATSGGTTEPITLFCEPAGAGDRADALAGDPSVGSSVTGLGEHANTQVPITAVVEADADSDGFGDETQDKCPQSASAQGDCPTVAIDASSAIKRKGSVVILVTTSSAAPVATAGTVNLGKGKKAKLNGGTQTVSPGKISRFTLKFPGGLKAKLAKLDAKRTLQLKVTVTATDLVGRVTTDILKARLRGQA